MFWEIVSILVVFIAGILFGYPLGYTDGEHDQMRS